MAGKWETQWTEAKKTFEKRAEKKKPKATVGTNMSKRVGIRKVLGKCDKYHDAAEKLNDQRKYDKAMAALEKLKVEVAKFQKLSDSYWMDIQTAMTKEKDKSIMPELDILRKHLRALRDTILARAAIMEDSIKKLSILDVMAKNLRISINGGMKRALLFLAQAKKRNDTAFWNDGLMKAARDVYQQIGNVKTLRAKSKVVPGIPMTDPTAIIEPMRVWRDGNPKFDVGKETDMQKEIIAFLKCLQAIDRWLKTA